MLNLDPEIEERVRRLAEARGMAAESLLREAVEQYVVREERLAAGEHPSGKPWPRKHAVGGIITPV